MLLTIYEVVTVSQYSHQIMAAYLLSVGNYCTKALMFIFLLRVESYGELQSKTDSTAAFCMQSIRSSFFPTPPPEFNLPWVWDAVYDTSTTYVDVTTLPQLACEFNKTLWNRIIDLYPQYSQQLSDGMNSNILVDIKVNKKQFDFPKSIASAQIACIFYYDGKATNYRTMSLPVNVKGAFAGIGTTQIHCPVPAKAIKWDSLRLEQDLQKIKKFAHPGIELKTNSTTVFPVCKLHHKLHRNGEHPIFSDKGPIPKHTYQLSICTATQRTSRARMVEWIEYHLLQGIFPIYHAHHASHHPL